MAPLMEKFVMQYDIAAEITESKISAEIAPLREKYAVMTDFAGAL